MEMENEILEKLREQNAPLSELYLAEYCNEYVEIGPDEWGLLGVNKTCDEYKWYLKIQALENENEKLNEWHKPSEKPERINTETWSVVVFSEWDDGIASKIYFDFERDNWRWTESCNPIVDDDFMWHYIPKRKE